MRLAMLELSREQAEPFSTLSRITLSSRCPRPRGTSYIRRYADSNELPPLVAILFFYKFCTLPYSVSTTHFIQKVMLKFFNRTVICETVKCSDYFKN